MNKLEQSYADLLEQLKLAGKIRWWKFEEVKFKLADRTWYTPDFIVELENGEIELHEVKGYWQDDARVKIKVAAREFWPFVFRAVRPKPKKDGGGWEHEVFGGHDV